MSRRQASHTTWLQDPRLAVRWVVLHGLVRAATRRWAAAGDLQARLIADPSTRIDPVPIFEQLRSAGPMSRTRIGQITTNYRVANAILRSDDFRTTSIGTSVPPPLRWVERATRGDALHPLSKPSLLTVEPPDHTRYRTLVSSVFTARAVAAMRAQVQSTADRLLDSLSSRAHAGVPVDIVTEYCAQLPVAVISDILGVPEGDRKLVLEFGELAAPSLDIGLPWRQFRRVEHGLSGFDHWLAAHLAALRRSPGDDLMSQLTVASVDGRRLDDDELRATAGLVLVAGFETTVNLLGNGVKLLIEHPDQLARLLADPMLWPTAVEEVLRLESPVQLTARIATRDTTIEGNSVAEGELVSVLLAAANRDPEMFDDPHTFDVSRPNANRHLAFSGGRHFCVGAALARVEGEVGLRSLFERFPDLRAVGNGTRRSTRVLRGWSHLPVILRSSARTGSATWSGAAN